MNSYTEEPLNTPPLLQLPYKTFRAVYLIPMDIERALQNAYSFPKISLLQLSLILR